MQTTVSESKPKPTAFAWLILACGALFFFYEFCLQASPGVMVPELMKAFHVNAGQLGLLSACYFYAYALMQLPVGLLLDRFGPRIMMTIACFVCALGAFIFSQTETLLYAEFARFLMGLGSACALINALKLASLWFPANRFALLAGLLVMFGMLGAMSGQGPLAHFVTHYGWRQSMEILSYMGFTFCVLFYLIVRNGPLFAIYREKSQEGFSRAGVKEVLGNGQVWWMALYAALMFAPTPAFGELWGVPYLVSTFGVSTELAARVLQMLFLGWVVGCPLFGYLSDRAGTRIPFIRFACWVSLLVMAFIVLIAPVNIWLMGFGLFAFGLFSSAFVLVFSMAKEATQPCYAGTASGFINMLNELAPAFLQVGIGLVLDYCWGGQMQDGIRHYAPIDYHHASFSLLAVVAMALAVVYFIKPKRE